MLDALFVTPSLTAVSEALGAEEEGRLAVIGHAKLAAGLAAMGREVLPVGLSARAAKRLTGALPDLSGIEDGALAGLVGVDIALDAGWEQSLRGWARVVRDGGTIVFVDRGRAPEASRRALSAGLSEIEQRRAGRTVVTSGIVSHL